jgi:hypothetical protein
MLFMKALNILKVVIDYTCRSSIFCDQFMGTSPNCKNVGKKTQSCPKIGIIIICAPDLSN